MAETHGFRSEQSQASNKVDTPFNLKKAGEFWPGNTARELRIVNIFDELKRASTEEGKLNRNKFFSALGQLVENEVGERGWEGSKEAYKYYSDIFFGEVGGFVGTTEFSREMMFAHLRNLMTTAPFREKMLVLSDYLGLKLM